MNQMQKYTWLIDTIHRAGKISQKDLSDKWERAIEYSNGDPLPRATFYRWRNAIYDIFKINIECQNVGGYLYYISNPEDIDEDKLKKWMLDSFAVGNLIGENLSLKGRIIVDEIPSGRDHLTTILEAMKENRVVNISYRPFNKSHGYTFPIEPYCVKLFENRWYVLAHNNRDEIKIYGLDRFENVEITDETFKLPKDFDADDFFSTAFGVVIGYDVKPERIVIRANESHKYYLGSLPLHHSQRLIEDYGEYADFELYLSPTYDFVMKLLQYGSMIEVISPASLRETIKVWISDMNELYMDERLPAAEAVDKWLPATEKDSSPFLDKQSEIEIATGDLPHWHQDGKLLFVTFRLSDSLPQTKIATLKQEISKFTAIHPRPWNEDVKKEYWKIIGPIENKLLDNGYGSCILKDNRIRKIVSDAIFYKDGQDYHVLSFVIMPNHVHMLLQLKGEHTVMEIMHSIKSFTANRINETLGREGSVWMKEYFDRMIRSESHLHNCLDYIRDNPKYLREGEYQVYFSSAAGSRPSTASAAENLSSICRTL